jgi:hypothetical protein
MAFLSNYRVQLGGKGQSARKLMAALFGMRMNQIRFAFILCNFVTLRNQINRIYGLRDGKSLCTQRFNAFFLSKLKTFNDSFERKTDLRDGKLLISLEM